MPLIFNSVSVPLSAVVDNVFAGSQFEFLPFASFLEFGVVGDANGADLRIDIYSGQDVLVENMVPSILNRAPIYPDDYPLNDVAGMGERIKLRVRNVSAAAARVLFFSLKLTPV